MLVDFYTCVETASKCFSAPAIIGIRSGQTPIRGDTKNKMRGAF